MGEELELVYSKRVAEDGGGGWGGAARVLSSTSWEVQTQDP